MSPIADVTSRLGKAERAALEHLHGLMDSGRRSGIADPLDFSTGQFNTAACRAISVISETSRNPSDG